jgi:hypothetical protein
MWSAIASVERHGLEPVAAFARKLGAANATRSAGDNPE